MKFQHLAEGGIEVGGEQPMLSHTLATGGIADVDLWERAPVDDGTLSMSDRKSFPREARQPALWKYLDAAGRATACTVALEAVAAEPDLDNHTLAGRMLDRLRQRMAHAAPAEAARLQEICGIVSQYLATVPDLGWHLRQRGDLLQSLIRQRGEIGALIARLQGGQP